MRTSTLVAFALLAVACQRGVVTPEAPSTTAADPLRLPRTVEPKAYQLWLNVDPSQPTFSGIERIAVNVTEPTRRIRIHGQDLKVQRARLQTREGVDIWLEYHQLTPDGASELVTGADIPAGDGELEIEWSAEFGKQVDGLYHVHEGDQDYAFTQFEAIAARKMIPCFDEPAFKTPFDVSVRIRASDNAVGNAPAIAEQPAEEGYKSVRFARTAPLPTYLLALAVGPLEIVVGPDVPPNEARPKPLPLRGVAVKGKGHLLKFALAHTGELVTILEQYFGIAYPWDKLDIIAVPDFGPGAMENAGAITFKEFLILMEVQAPPDQRRAFAGVTAHELAHQWFGDLVTMDWWDDIWLNEAFASWMSARVTQIWEPTMKSDVSLVANMEDLMNADSYVSARRIRQPVETVGDIFNAFDGITYTKGAGVISMFETWVGREKFQKGLHEYFTRHRFGTGSTTDFLASISGSAGRDIAPAFRTFLDQPGVPLLRLQRSCDQGRSTLQISQERFRPLGSQISGAATWQVPFCYRRGAGAAECSLVETPQAQVTLAGTSCDGWLLPNTGGSGYYRFTLDEASARALVAARASLAITEQLAVIDSINAAERAGWIEIPAALSLLLPFADSPDRRVAAAPIGLLHFLRTELADDTTRPFVEKRAREVYGPVLARLQAEKRDDEQTLFLRQVLGWMTAIGRDPTLRAQASAVGLHFLRPETPAPAPSLFDDPANLELALNITVEDGDASVLEALIARLQKPADPMMRVRLVGALAHARGTLGPRARALVLDATLRVSEVLPFLRTQMSAWETRKDAWGWFQEHGDKVIARLDEQRAGGLPYLAAAHCEEDRAREVEAYFQPRLARLPGSVRILAGALEGIRLCTARKAAHGKAAAELLRAEVAGTR